MAKNVLVTGGLGFLGSHVVDRLVERGDHVRVLDLINPDEKQEGVEYVKGSVTDKAVVKAAMKGMDQVIHLAAKAGLWTRNKRDFYDINQDGSENIYRAAEEAGIERAVHCSTESILQPAAGKKKAGDTIDETVQCTVYDMPGDYCKAKFLAEEEARKAAKRGLPIVIVNPTVPVGPGDRRITPPSRMVLGYLNGKYPAFLNTMINFVDSRDVADGHLAALDRGKVGERYILGGQNLELSEFLQILEEVSGVPMPKKKVPYWLAYTVSVFSEFVSDRFTGTPPQAPKTGVRLARVPIKLDNSKARRELGINFRPIRESLADEVQWFKDLGMVK